MKISYFGHFALVIGLSALVSSCDQPVGPKVGPEKVVISTADLAREARFSPWTSRAGLQLKMERLPGDQYFAAVQGRLKDGANQYRAISETFDGETYREWSVFWGLNERELFEEEIALLRSGFERRDSQTFTDSAGVAIHQLVMLRRVTALSFIPPSGTSGRVAEGALVPVVPSVETTEAVEVPDFIQPELRPIDDTPVAPVVPPDSNADLLAGASGANVIANPLEIENAGRAEVVEEAPPAPPALVDSPVVRIAPASDVKPDSGSTDGAAPAPAPESKAKSHRVSRGDTLSGIARQYGVRVSDLKRANGLRTDIIRLKQVLKIPVR